MVFDYKKEYKEFYMPKNKPSIVEIPKMNYIAVRGTGNPNEENGDYQNTIGLLYGIAYTIKMSYKGTHKIDGFKVYATDLWSDPEENKKFFNEMGLTDEQIISVKADATDLKYEKEFFDAVVSTDSYNYFGRDDSYLDDPKELLLSWTPEQLDYIHDIEYWKNIVSKSKDSEIVSIHEMESNEECWSDWIKCDNEYSKNDKKAIDAGACKYLNFISIILRKK